MTRHDPDARATLRASLSIGWQIMLASAVLVLGIVVVAVVFILHQGLPREQLDRDESTLPHVYVDTGDVYKALVLIGIGAVLFAGLVSWIIARRAVRPLGQALRRQREFVADASHELRTPLAVLDARIQVFQRRLTGPTPPDALEAARTVSELRSDSRALVDIVNDLLLAAGGGDSARTAAFPAGPVIVGAVDSLRILATEREVRLVVDVDDTVSVRIPATALRRCVIALVDNALSHTRPGTTVSVTARRRGDVLRLEVTDEGAGILGITPERVFDRFAHAAPVSGTTPQAGAGEQGPRARPGFGIGLALVREIANRQGGRVLVASTGAAGTTMALELPTAR
ncbi:sensor histidine kinase [Frondihabitans cladoniiphilus]|uniref:histidine kinase n=1 Tax=Frondihabitans cladoniiphilus TaxID=715785 RepID=A0ABP8W5A4_9MICO